MPFQFHYPEFFLLAIPLFLAFRRWGLCRDRITAGLRFLIAFLLLLALAGPEWNLGGAGLDVIVIVDRSRSMNDRAIENAEELIDNLDENRDTGDRVGVVTFGSTAEVERLPSAQAFHNGFEKEISENGSDLNSAILTALSLVDRNRPARILVLSDGESNGADPQTAARRAREFEVPIDYRSYDQPRNGDVAIDSLTLPRSIGPREPFQFRVKIFSDRVATVTVDVIREGTPLASQTVELQAGINSVPFRDVLPNGGFYTYEAKIEIENDPILQNNRGLGVVRVTTEPKLLVLNSTGSESNLAKALRAGKISVDVQQAKRHPLTQDSLDSYRAVILENVPADDLGRLKMARLAQYVEDLGGGVLMTGGENSFGTGGYHNSPLEPVLPVSMELKDDARKLRVAIAVVLDQSGSMSAPVAGGMTKMDLANQGASEVVRLLTKQDRIAVIPVTSRANTVQPLEAVTDPQAVISRVSQIRAGGAGIFVFKALEAAGEELRKADDFQTRHIILFSDAQDSVAEQGYRELMEEFEKEGITTSVIGLGKESDIHADLLKDIAARGNGNVLFTTDARELPRLFTQETMKVAGGTFIKKDATQPAGITGELLADAARLMGDFDFGRFPRVDGYNLTYLKPAATESTLSRDEFKAPWSAFWSRGLGRAAVLTMDVSGEFAGEFARWSYYRDYLVMHARWLMGGSRLGDFYIDLERDGQDAVITVEFDPERTRSSQKPPKLYVVPPGLEREKVLVPDFQWIGPDTIRARFRMEYTGTYRTLVQTETGRLIRGPAVALPYSPEFAPRDEATYGRRVLARVADLSGGKSRLDVLSIWKDPPKSARMVPLLPYLVMVAIGLLVLEIAGRRLALWKGTQATVTDVATRELLEGTDYRARWFSRKRKVPGSEPAVEEKTAPQSAKENASVNQIYTRAKQRARHRMHNE